MVLCRNTRVCARLTTCREHDDAILQPSTCHKTSRKNITLFKNVFQQKLKPYRSTFSFVPLFHPRFEICASTARLFAVKGGHVLVSLRRPVRHVVGLVRHVKLFTKRLGSHAQLNISLAGYHSMGKNMKLLMSVPKWLFCFIILCLVTQRSSSCVTRHNGCEGD